MNDHGETTQDILALGQQHPAEQDLPYDAQEAAIRLHGRRCRRTGTTIIGGSYFLSLIAAIIADLNLFGSPLGQLFGVLGLVILNTLGGVILSAGLAERRQRPERAMFRVACAKANENGQRLEHNGARMDRIEAAIDRIAEHLPEALDQANWRGYAAAERQRLTVESTGTDGHRTPHLGLVPQHRPPED